MCALHVKLVVGGSELYARARGMKSDWDVYAGVIDKQVRFTIRAATYPHVFTTLQEHEISDS